MIRRCQAWLPWLRTLAAVALLAGLGWRFGTGAVVAGLRAIDAASVLAALGIGLLTTVASAARWCVVARGLGLPLPMRGAVSDYYRATLLNAVLPAGVLGDAHRAWDHGRRSGDVERGVRAVVLERCAGQLVLAAAGAVALLGAPALVAALLPGLGGALVLLAVLAGAVAVLAARFRTLRPVLARSWADARTAVLTRSAVPRLVLLSAAALAGHLALFLVAAHAAGSPLPLPRLLPLGVLALLVMALPVNVGGWGPREAFLAMAFGAAGTAAAHGLTVAVVYGTLALVAALPGAVPLLRGRALQRREVGAERRDQRGEQLPALAR
ncbi:uncharacterized membrane protein YbhN (UPF0104 family) [Prauserella shujinwangii]|uniref:Uncharacterized membrane protein YbhN (UPF0104 family) n=1 Tax=Prauserella shujinwangii TaxID=1453103 RepID=A0A2T0M2Y7_9PSEU|nr:lysylphosphatidylglycerol synthase domain-containing protein [Prauserella shujinwangii]PRX51097.1 uncharacterized membrane protein YbhN (UPF0104 family) [Prauserella shujinwangii]